MTEDGTESLPQSGPLGQETMKKEIGSEGGGEPSRLTRNVEKLKDVIKRLTDKLSSNEPALRPQQELAMKALELKLARISSSLNFVGVGPILLGSTTFVPPTLYDSANPCFVRRGMDRRTLYQATRRIRRSKKTGYAMPDEALSQWQQHLLDDWALEKSRQGLRMVTAPHDIRLKQWAAMARAARAAGRAE